ncbi:hypothetical protein CLV84_1022 [Neolewinella xylanilytica]|uniref:Uncharacterized protein n=1 Tax=Neolewinella xylanilytica TaxID=1514080 RepID=A0A2S6I9B2_9BACT|nr:hypothetical protein CLV84_1022 [Neolewinella xylanilytica]
MMALSTVFRVKQTNIKAMVMAYSSSIVILAFFSSKSPPLYLVAIALVLTLLFWAQLQWANKLRGLYQQKLSM